MKFVFPLLLSGMTALNARAEKEIVTEGTLHKRSDCKGTGICRVLPADTTHAPNPGNVIIRLQVNADRSILSMVIDEDALQTSAEAYEQISEGYFIMQEPFTFPRTISDALELDDEITVPAGNYSAVYRAEEGAYCLRFNLR